MFDLNQNQLLGALTYLTIAVFLAGGLAPLRQKRVFRWAAVAIYLAFCAAVLISIGLWLAGIRA